MNTKTITNIISSVALVAVLFVGAWATVDALSLFGIKTVAVAEAVIDCHGCFHYVDGPGFIGGGSFGGFGGGGEIGGGGGGDPVLSCALFTSTPSLSAPGNVTLQWTTLLNANSFSINNGIGSVTPVAQGSKSTYVSQTTTFTGTVTKGTQTKTCSVTVTVTPPPTPPVCTLDLTKNNISWTSNYANTVTITPLTNSPQVPGATGGTPGGTTVFSGDFGTFKANNATKFQTDATTNGGVTLGNASFKANKATADRLCSIVYPGSVNGTYQTDNFSSPGNNTIAIWNGSSWSVVPASGNDPHLRYNFTCVTASSGGTYPLSGSHNFVPPLGVGTHTYLLTATGPGGTAQCQKTVIVPPPPAPGCIEVVKETYNTEGDILTPVAQFTFSLDGVATTTSNSNGYAKFSNVTPGVHTVTEVPPGSAWQLVSVTPSNGVLTVPSGPTCVTVVFKNKQVLPDSPQCDLTLTKKKLTWNTTNVSSVTIVPLTASPTIGVNLPVDGYKDFNPDLGVGTHTYKLTGQGTNGDEVTCEKTVVVPPPEAFNCTLSANKTTITTPGEAVLISYTADNIIKAVLNSVTLYDGPVHDFAGTHTVNPTQTTTYTGTVTGVGGETKTCSITITYTPTTPAPVCSLNISKSKIKSGESVKVGWTSSYVSQGFISPAVGTTSPVASGLSDDIFPSDSTTYTGVFTGQYGTTTCSVAVEVEKGGGGCQGNCGGGLNQPTVTLLNKPGEQPLAFVSLSQVPYTGFEAGALLTMIFWFAVVAWSIGITYIFVGKESMRLVASRVLGITSHLPDVHEQDAEYVEYEEREHYEEEHVPHATHVHASTLAMPQSYAITPTVIATPEPKEKAVDGVPSLAGVIESRAHASGVLLSPEAVEKTLALSSDRSEALRQFGAILNEAVRTLPREDGWILISSDRLTNLIEKVGGKVAVEVVAPRATETVAPVVTDSVAEQFVGAVLTGNRDAAFSLLGQLETTDASASEVTTRIVSTLDGLYRAKIGMKPFANVALLEKASLLSGEGIRKLVEVFAQSLETSYTARFTGLKIALAQAFEIKN